MPLNLLAVYVGGMAFTSFWMSAAKPKLLPVGSCIANKLLCNANEKDIDPWEVKCYGGAFLKIAEVGKRSYRTTCIENTAQCKEFVLFEDVKAYYFPIECPSQN